MKRNEGGKLRAFDESLEANQIIYGETVIPAIVCDSEVRAMYHGVVIWRFWDAITEKHICPRDKIKKTW